MKKIAFVTGSMGRGGAERVISVLANHYAAQGYDVQILMLLHKQVEYELDSRIKVRDLSNESKNATLDMPRMISAVRRFVKTEKPEAVVAFMAQICLVTGLACMGLPTRLILSERIDPAAVKRGKFYEKILFGLYARADKLVLQTKRARDYFPENVRKNSQIIPNPIAVKCLAQPRRKHRIVTAGRLNPQKNQAMLIRAFASVHKNHPEYTLDIYGEGALQETLQQLISSLGLEQAITLKGNVLGIHEAMADAEIFVLPSDFEGLSNALLEAMMMGLCCIATNCAGCDEVIENGENGILIPVGDQNALEKALEQLIADPELTQKLGENAKETSSQYAVDAVIEKWHKAIEG